MLLFGCKVNKNAYQNKSYTIFFLTLSIMNDGVFSNKQILITHYPSPCGDLLLGSYGDQLCLCDWYASKHRPTMDRRLQTRLRATYIEGMSDTLCTTICQLDEYFSGLRTAFQLPLLMVGTEFQRRVWQTLLTVPFGATASYADIATKVGNANAVRAVAAANGANPIAIVVPCHRIIGSDHSLTGYAGGLEAKKFLLELEKR